MKKIFLSVVLLVNLFAYEVAPSWYPSTNTNTFIAFGDGKDFDSAILSALININNEVNSTLKITNLDIDILEEDMIENHFFIKIEYKSKTLLAQLTKDIKNLTFKGDEETDKYLLNTKLLKDLYSTFSYFPNISMDLNYLYFNENKYIIKSKDFENLLSNTTSPDIFLDLNDILISGETYFLKILPSYSGYVTLLQVTGTKDFKILFSNKLLRTNKATIYPNFKSSDGLEVVLSSGILSTKIMTMAVICQTKKEFSDRLSLTSFLNKIGECSYTSIVSKVN
ncbi:MAG TPA: hypothetical protein EYG97_02745 [Arcobacter sp.]|nr:hypothetical protein [Arcobacter sp.]HIP55918.1 hypothetical protein [Arcobacter sp.]